MVENIEIRLQDQLIKHLEIKSLKEEERGGRLTLQMSLHHMSFFKKTKNPKTLKEVCNFLDRQILLSQVHEKIVRSL